MVESRSMALASGARCRAAGDEFLPFLNGLSRPERADDFRSPTAGDVARRDDERRRERRSQDDQRADATAQALAPQTHSQIVGEQERTLAPGSRAAARLERNTRVATDRQERGHAFQRALQDAASQARDRQQLAEAPQASEPPHDAVAINSTGAATRPESAAARSAATQMQTQGESKGLNNPSPRPTTEGENRSTSSAAASTPLPSAPSQHSPATIPVPTGSAPPPPAAVAEVQTPSPASVTARASGAASLVGRNSPPASALPATIFSADRAARPERAPFSSRTTTTEPTTRDGDVNIERIVRVVQGQIDRNRSTTTIRLDPPELGMIRLRLDLRNDGLALRIEAQSNVAHQLLRSELDALRSSLDAAGIQLQQVELRSLSEMPADGGETWTPAERRQGWQDSADSAQREFNGREHGGDTTARQEPGERMDPNVQGSVGGTAEVPRLTSDAPATGARRIPAPRVNVLA